MDLYRPTWRPVEASINDQRFLLSFIMGTYLGPDVKTDVPRRSASQRIAEGLPPYNIADLRSTFLKHSDIESLYYYVLRNAHPSAVLKLQSLDLYFKGNLPPTSSDNLEDECQFTQFTSLFPLDIHAQSRYKGSFKIFNGIVVIDNPAISHIMPEDLQRFMRLTGVNELKIDRDEALLYRHGYRTDRDESEQIPNHTRFCMETPAKDVPNGNATVSAQRRNSSKRRRISNLLQMQEPSHIAVPAYPLVQSSTEEALPMKTIDLTGPAMVVLGSTPKIEQWKLDTSIILTGTAKDGRAGPPVGLVDIGIGKDAYLFRVALPGVKKDQCQFSCEIEGDGKVQIRGVTATGERAILRHSRLFQMKTHHLCPPGPFTVSFSLPGLVDPRLFKGNFGSDGIFEAVIMKYRVPNHTSPQVST